MTARPENRSGWHRLELHSDAPLSRGDIDEIEVDLVTFTESSGGRSIYDGHAPSGDGTHHVFRIIGPDPLRLAASVADVVENHWTLVRGHAVVIDPAGGTFRPGLSDSDPRKGFR